MKDFKIISGGQTGVDMAALVAAKEAGINTGGHMPAGFTNHDGKHPEYAKLYGMEETFSIAYQPRTALNVKNSDATIRIAANFDSSGELFTLKMINQYNKPYFDVSVFNESINPVDVAKWIFDNNFKVINIAGNSERTCPNIGDFAKAFVASMVEELKKLWATNQEL